MSDITMTPGSLMVVADPAVFDGDNFKAGTEKSVVRLSEKINLGVEITGLGFSTLSLAIFLESDGAGGFKLKMKNGKIAAARWTVEYYAESFGPGSNDVLLGTKQDFLVFGQTSVSQKDTAVQIDPTDVEKIGNKTKTAGSKLSLDPGVYKLTAVVKWAQTDDTSNPPVIPPLSGHAAFIEGGTIEIVE